MDTPFKAIAIEPISHETSLVALLALKIGLAGMFKFLDYSLASDAVPATPIAPHPVTPDFPVQTL